MNPENLKTGEERAEEAIAEQKRKAEEYFDAFKKEKIQEKPEAPKPPENQKKKAIPPEFFDTAMKGVKEGAEEILGRKMDAFDSQSIDVGTEAKPFEQF